MPVYDVCAQVASVSAGATIGLATCDGSDLQTFVFGNGGTISPASDTSLCFTVSAETRFGRSDVHQISDMTLAACSDDLTIYQQWGYRATLEDEITVLGS
ncbi:MAG: ricin-type beta-trefoil lectin domain protein [Chloroflexota bacterium]